MDLGTVHEAFMLAIEPNPRKKRIAFGHTGRNLEVESLGFRRSVFSRVWASTVVRSGNLPCFSLVDREADLAGTSRVSGSWRLWIIGEVSELEVGILTSLPGHGSRLGIELVKMATAKARRVGVGAAVGAAAAKGIVELLVQILGLLVDGWGSAKSRGVEQAHVGVSNASQGDERKGFGVHGVMGGKVVKSVRRW